MSSVLLGLVAALSWGVNDFLARFPSRAVGPLPTVLVVTFAGLVVLTVWLLLSGHSIRISWPQLWLPATSGIFFHAFDTLAFCGARPWPRIPRRSDRRLLSGARHVLRRGARRAAKPAAVARG